MKSRSKNITQQLLKLLQDDTRLAIYIHLIVFKKMTLKQLSEYLGKGKTTIHHHIKKYEEENILSWDEMEEDRKKLKTRHYYLSDELVKDLNDERLRIDKMELNALISKSLTELTIEYIRKRPEPAFSKLSIPPIISMPLSDEGLQIYEEFISKMIELKEKEKTDRETDGQVAVINHFSSSLLVPIQEIFEWKLKQNTAED